MLLVSDNIKDKIEADSLYGVEEKENVIKENMYAEWDEKFLLDVTLTFSPESQIKGHIFELENESDMIDPVNYKKIKMGFYTSVEHAVTFISAKTLKNIEIIHNKISIIEKKIDINATITKNVKSGLMGETVCELIVN